MAPLTQNMNYEKAHRIDDSQEEVVGKEEPCPS